MLVFATILLMKVSPSYQVRPCSDHSQYFGPNVDSVHNLGPSLTVF